MKVFDKINPNTLERREFQLGILAISTIAVMAAGLTTFMYQTVFSIPVAMGDPTMRKVFFAFCALSILMISYLINRQVVIYRLRGRLAENQNRITQIRAQASSDLVKTLPGFSRFQDRLTMDFRRCANSREPLSVLLFLLNPNANPSDKSQIANIYGDAAKAMLLTMRKDDSLYLFESGTLGVVLPGFNTTSAGRVADRFSSKLFDISNGRARFSFMSRVLSFPEEFSSAREMEQAARSLVPTSIPMLPSLEEEEDPAVETICQA